MNDGGPAFPGVDEHGNYFNKGLSLRDYFAGKALTGILASAGGHVKYGEPMTQLCDYAEMAYCLADEMIKARSAAEEEK